MAATSFVPGQWQKCGVGDGSLDLTAGCDSALQQASLTRLPTNQGTGDASFLPVAITGIL